MVGGVASGWWERGTGGSGGAAVLTAWHTRRVVGRSSDRQGFDCTIHKKEREKDKANVAWLDGENFVCAMCDLGWVGVGGVMGEWMRNRPMYRVFSRTQTKVSDQFWRRKLP